MRPQPTIAEALEAAGYRVEPRRSRYIALSGQRAIVRVKDGEFMGDFYALDAHARFVTEASHA